MPGACGQLLVHGLYCESDLSAFTLAHGFMSGGVDLEVSR